MSKKKEPKKPEQQPQPSSVIRDAPWPRPTSDRPSGLQGAPPKEKATT